jgi:NhaP-type Na+/H+ and K+/H+ antiporter
MLGLLVFPSQLGNVFVTGAVLALWIALVARPVAALAVLVSTLIAGRDRGVAGRPAPDRSGPRRATSGGAPS